MLGAGAIYFVILLVIFNLRSRATSFYYFCFISVTIYIMNVTKIGYHDPRPYMSDDQIIPYDCSHEYGNPSGHSIYAAGVPLFLFLDIFHGYLKSFTKLSYYLSLGGVIFTAIFIGFARLYVGVHSLN